LDALLPHQRLYFSSQDPKFEQLLRYLHMNSDTASVVVDHNAATTTTTTTKPAAAEIGIMGFDPQTGYVLSTGVLCSVPIQSSGGVTYGLSNNKERIMATSFKATTTCFQVVGEPWMDVTNSFYMANVAIIMGDQQQQQQHLTGTVSAPQLPPPLLSSKKAEQWFASIPTLVEQWKALVYQAEWTTPANMAKHHQLDEIGSHIPNGAKERAWWVAALLNPVGTIPLSHPQQQEQVIAHGLAPQNKNKYMTGADMRPHMLQCQSDEERLLLAVTALQASCDFLQRFIHAEQQRKRWRRE
jgi:hypothetical protein